jgi:protein phosphatase
MLDYQAYTIAAGRTEPGARERRRPHLHSNQTTSDSNVLNWKAMPHPLPKKHKPSAHSDNRRRKKFDRKKLDRKLAEEMAFCDAKGPFDVIGDVHGCLHELLELMAALGYEVNWKSGDFAVTPPKHRKLAFAGDLANRGPATPDVLRLVMKMVRAGQAYCVPGNQDVKLARALRSRTRGRVVPGVMRSLEQFAGEPAEFRAEVAKFLDGLASHYVLDDGNLVIAHAGLQERMHGSGSAKARKFALSGQNNGKLDKFGLPVRVNWAASYRGDALVVYGHTPVIEPVWLNNTVNIDTGCVYGGHLTALRYPERETVSVPAKAIYSESRRRFPANSALA